MMRLVDVAAPADHALRIDPGRSPGWPLFGALAILDPDLGVHSARGAGIALAMAGELGIDVPTAASWAFVLRDIGTLEVPTRILQKAGPLTPAEQGVVSGHALRSAQLLDEVRELADGARTARRHHERWDGAGYPDGLQQDAIPLEARILAIADAFAALTAPRPHRPSAEPDEALEIITQQAGHQFDPVLVWVLAGLVPGLDPTLLRHRRAADLPGLGPRLTALAHRAEDLSRGQLEALFAVAMGIGPDEAADRCGRSLGTHRNWVSSLRRSLNCPARQPLPQFLARLGRELIGATLP